MHNAAPPSPGSPRSLFSLTAGLAAALLGLAVRPAALAVPATPPAGAPAGPAAVFETMAAEQLPPSAASFLVEDAETGRVVAAHDADTPRSPASTLKVVTTIAALETLGPAYTWHTRAWVRGTIGHGVLDGDLILQGGGDPYMTLERWWSFAHLLRTRGLRAIHGDIVIDATWFDLPKTDPGAFDGLPNRAYNVVPDALMVNFQSVEFNVAADPDTHRVEIVADPAPVNLAVDNRIRYSGGRCSGAARRVDFAVASPAWDRVVFTGMLSPHCAARSFTRLVLTPSDYAFGTFVSLWRELGGEFTGRLRTEAAPGEALPFASFDSLTLGEIVRLTNKFSSNLMARHLLLTMGRERFGGPATPGKGAAAIGEWGRTHGIDLTDVDLDNGSGLSRSTRITVRTLSEVLFAAYHSRFAPEFMASLPLAGLDGTLHARFKDVPAGSVRLKTGHLDGVSGIAGYATGADGRTYVVVCLVNHPRADFGAGEPVHAALVRWVQGAR